MSMNLRPLIEDRPLEIADRSIVLAVVLAIAVIGLVLLAVLLLPVDVHADQILRLLNG